VSHDQLEGRNPVLECLQRGQRTVHRIWLDRGARPDPRVSRILKLAERRGVKIERVDRKRLDRMAEGRVHNGVVAHVDEVAVWTAAGLLSHQLEVGIEPFWVLADGLSYEHNLGAVMRSALGFGANGLVIPTRRGASLSPVVQRVSMGAVEVVPVVRESLFAVLKTLKKAGIPTVGADMGGQPMTQARLSGPLALVMGAEGRGLSPKLREKVSRVVSVPLAGGLESLNVSVATAVLMYEKRRQDGWFEPQAPSPVDV
jgi:23S rRNA (guanosine2251-2'-O)-methyltransferase